MALLVAGSGSTLFLVEAWWKREKRGWAWCAKHKIGPLREELRAPAAQTPVAILTLNGAITPAKMYAEAGQILATHCSVCPEVECPWHRA